MLKHVHNVLAWGQRRKHDVSEGVELSSAVPEGAELQGRGAAFKPVVARAVVHAASGDASCAVTSSSNSSSSTTENTLGAGQTTSGDPLGDAAAATAPTPPADAAAAVATDAWQQQQVAPPHHWCHSAPSAARLVLSVVIEHCSAAQQGALLATRGWQAACEHCRHDGELLRTLLQRYVPHSMPAMQQHPRATAADNGTPHQLLQLLAAVVLLGEAHRLLLQQPGAWPALQQLLAHQQVLAQQAAAAADPLSSSGGGRAAAAACSGTNQAQDCLQAGLQDIVWPLVQAWMQRLQDGGSRRGSSGNRSSWPQIAAAVMALQHRDQHCHHQQQQQQRERPLVLLRQVPGLALPRLLTAADLAPQLQLQRWPSDQLQLLLLLRLVSSTAASLVHQPPGVLDGQQLGGGTACDSEARADKLQQLLGQATQALLAVLPQHTAAAVAAAVQRREPPAAAPGCSSDGDAAAGATPPESVQAHAERSDARPRAGGAAAALHPVEEPPAATDTAAERAAASQTLDAQHHMQPPPPMPLPAPVAVPAREGPAAAEAPAAGEHGPGGSSWPAELLSGTQLWPGEDAEGEDAAAISREERTLRAWMNSLLHQHSTAVAGGSARTSDSSSSSTNSLRPRASAGGASSGWQSPRVAAAAAAGKAGVARHGDAGAAPPARSISADAAACSSADEGTRGDAQLLSWCAAPSSLPSSPRTTRPHAAAATPARAPPTTAAAASAGIISSSTAAAAAGSTAGPMALAPRLTSVSSLFGGEVRSGVLLLELLELLVPGCVDWRVANRPPFQKRTAQLRALENCQLALTIAKEELGLPLVSMTGRDIMQGRRKIILSLVYQLMRYHTMLMLESISAAQPVQEEAQRDGGGAAGGSFSSSSRSRRASAPGSDGTRGAPVNICSSSRKQRRRPAVREQDILDWANGKLQHVQSLGGAHAASAAAFQAPAIRSFRDPVLASGVVLLQLLHVLAPELVDLAYVTPGVTPEQRQSNARYALALADRLGCSLFLVWEDLVDPPQPRMVLVLLASLMVCDLQRAAAAAAVAAA